jgi:hypothetical protein
MGWTGNTANGVAGNTSEGFKNSVFLRINFYRAFAGVPAGVTNNPAWSAMDQSAALMMSANNKVDHHPAPSWKFYSAGGATAAGKSNLSLSTCGSDAIASYMEDPGNHNGPVGHRRWILYPQTRQMGTGDVPASGANYAANALWTFDLDNAYAPRPAVRDEFVAWPPKGFVPYQLIYPRWSFSYPAANFALAQVSITRNGTGIPVNIVSRVEGYGENTVTFVPSNLNPNAWAGPERPAGDTTYQVTVSNVLINGAPRQFTYNVIAFDPAVAGGDSPNAAINGPATPAPGVETLYNVAPQTLATGYQWKYSSKAAYTTMIGAETAAGVIPKVQGGYSFRDKKIKSSGAYSYHLVHPRFTEGSFVLSDSVLCSGNTVLNFFSRLTYATSFERATVEVSTDGGSQWQSVWMKKGTNNAGQKSFTKQSVSLAAFSGREVKVRFRYALVQGSAYTTVASGVGWYVDNISFANAQKLTDTVVSGVSPTPTFSLVPAAGRTYVLQSRPLVLGRFFADWSVAKTITTP